MLNDNIFDAFALVNLEAGLFYFGNYSTFAREKEAP
jgi:hypothetical protein